MTREPHTRTTRIFHRGQAKAYARTIRTEEVLATRFGSDFVAVDVAPVVEDGCEIFISAWPTDSADSGAK